MVPVADTTLALTRTGVAPLAAAVMRPSLSTVNCRSVAGP